METLGGFPYLPAFGFAIATRTVEEATAWTIVVGSV
jgi:hypothetical protein